MKKFSGLSLLVFALAISFVGCDLFQESRGGTVTVINDTRENVEGKFAFERNFSRRWSLSAGESWSESVDEDSEYSISFPSWYDNDNYEYHNSWYNSNIYEYHDGEEKSGSLAGGDKVTFYVSSYVPGLEPLADYVLFKNGNSVPVTVYSDSAHQNKIADIAANAKSTYLTNLSYYNRNGETHLYLVYHLFGAADFLYSYDFINVVNIASETPLPTLSQLASEEKDRMLTNDAYITVKNTSTFSLVLISGANEIPPLGSSSSVLGSEQVGTYRVNTGDTSSYKFKQNTISVVEFPSDLSTFSNGKLYALSYSGSNLSWAFGKSSNSSFTISVAGALSYGQQQDGGYIIGPPEWDQWY